LNWEEEQERLTMIAMRSSKYALVVLALIISPAHAENGTLHSVRNLPMVFVWKDYNALKEGIELLKAGSATKNPGLVAARVACIVPNETHAVTSPNSPGFGFETVIILSGEDTGCKGVIEMQDFKREPGN
jgi:hypothetical protein